MEDLEETKDKKMSYLWFCPTSLAKSVRYLFEIILVHVIISKGRVNFLKSLHKIIYCRGTNVSVFET
jgi:hypothetical protein